MSNKQKILIVDDNHINRQLFSMSLKKSGFEITTAENGYDAIDYATDNKYDLILMDIRMPEIDGYETTKKLKQLPNHLETPIIATSAENIPKEKKSCFNDFLLKPISPKLLTEIVKKYCTSNILEKTIFNQVSALKYAYNDKSIMLKLIEMFVEDLPVQMSILDRFIKQHDKQALDIIHKIRGSCKACGAQHLDFQLQQLASQINNNTPIEKTYEDTIKAVQEYVSMHLKE